MPETFSSNSKVLILGSTGVVAAYIRSVLLRYGFSGTVASRKRPELNDNFGWVASADLIAGQWQPPANAAVLSLWPIELLVKHVGRMRDCAQIIALSSTSIFSKADSNDYADRNLAERLRVGEARLEGAAKDLGIPITILRPTVIYDGMTDRSVRDIAALINRLGFFVIAGRGHGKRQPIHAEDVCEAMVRSIGCRAAYNRSLNIVGGETITYLTMVERIFGSLGTRPRIVHIPRLPLRFAVIVANQVGIVRHGPGVVDRMEEDLAFDNSEAVKVLGIKPRTFYPVIEI